MAKDVSFGRESREKLLKGIDTLANAVKVTLGPKRSQRRFRKNHMVHHSSPMMGSPSLVKSSWTTSSKTWELN